MSITTIAALTYCIVASIVVAFQLALALGVPWGEYSMGGRFPGKYPPRMRIVAVVNAVILAMTGLVVLSRAGLLLPRWPLSVPWLIWVVVAFSAVGFVMNLITPSRGERVRWAPATFAMLVTSLVIAIGPWTGSALDPTR
ncbi:MAG: hypothetical protein R2832_13455 [Rhodothermales bacterium]